jgi:hypothetical protein
LESSSTSPTPLLRFDLDFAGKVVTLAGSGCLLLSVIYDWGFIRALGLSFATIPTSLSDHLRSALNWLPGTIAYIGAAALVELINRRIEGGLTEQELLAKSKRPEVLRKFRDTPFKLFGVLAIVTTGLWIALGDSFRRELWVFIPMAWLNFSVWVIGHPTIRARTPRHLLLSFALIPAAVSSVYLLGDAAAHAALKNTEGPTAVLTTNIADTKRRLVLIRVFEHVAIVRDSDGLVSLTRTSDILRIEPQPQPPYPGFLCALLPRACTFSGSPEISKPSKRTPPATSTDPATGHPTPYAAP